MTLAAYNSTVQSYFWLAQPRSDAGCVIGSDYRVRFCGGRCNTTSLSWTQIMILIIILDTEHDLNLYLGLKSWIKIMISNLALQASFADPLLSLVKIYFGATSNPFLPLLNSYLFPSRISMLLYPEHPICLAWAKGPMPLLYNTQILG
jgi:hypothetical protein